MFGAIAGRAVPFLLLRLSLKSPFVLCPNTSIYQGAEALSTRRLRPTPDSDALKTGRRAGSSAESKQSDITSPQAVYSH